MREIRFRAWAYASEKMFYPSTDDRWEIVCGRLQPLPNTVLMQYTGRKDQNNMDIYEGDILFREEQETHEMGSYISAGEVIWHESSWYIKFTDGEIISLDDYAPETGWIAGNIHTIKGSGA